MTQIDVAELLRFHEVLPELRQNEVYVVLLIGIKKNERRILDTVLVKNNTFEEFMNKVGLMYSKTKRTPFATEVLIDINKKCVLKGLVSGFEEIQKMIEEGKDIRNFFSIFLQNIRYSSLTNYTLLKGDDILKELEPVYVVKYGDIYFNVFDKPVPEGITKPEIPVPGIPSSYHTAKLVYVRKDKE